MLKILLVDDENLLTNIVRRHLINLNTNHPRFEVITANSYNSAIEAIILHKFDLAFIDIILPGDNPNQRGFDFLQELKENQPDCKAYIWSGVPSSTNIARAVELGAADFIEKPFTPDDITRRIEASETKIWC